MSTTANVNHRLAALTAAGVSVWLDQIRRSLVEGGELARMVAEESLRGVTANLSIFEKAILGSTDYDEDLAQMAREQLDAKAIYERLAVHDVQLAADVLADVHRSSDGRDGFVSLEVGPELAHDTEGTLAEARSFWERLAAAGAEVQRPLWASIGTKNPSYPDTKYVAELIAPQTVNTMPLLTLIAVGDHGQVQEGTAEIDPAPALEALAQAGVDLDAVTAELLVDGVKQFEDAMTRLLAGIAERREAVVTGRPPTIQASIPAELLQAVAARVDRAVSESVAQRVLSRDPSLWGGPDVPEIENRLGWLTVSEQAAELRAFAAECRAEGFTDAVLLGMGGSSLSPEVIRRSFGELPDGLRPQVLDSTDPDVVLAVEESVDIAKTLFIVSCKSGGTIETMSHYRHFRAKAEPSQFVVVTDPGSPLEKLAGEDGLRRVFLNTPDIGGRYSVMSYFGLVPAALMGVNVEALLHRCQVGEQTCATFDSSQSNSGLWLGAALGELALQGRDKLTFMVSPPMQSFGLWAEQLVAESTGKRGRGMLPVADEPLGPVESYGPDRVFVYLRDPEQVDEAVDRLIAGLGAAGHPTFTLTTDGPVDLGRIFFLAEFATAVAGWALEINPFDQPNVREAKDNTARVLEAGAIPDLAVAGDSEGRLLLRDSGPPHYVAVMGYLPPSAELDEAISQLRAALRAARHPATTFGYGPRFLHSTGQMHKGGPPTGRFLQLVDTPARDAEIPGRPYSFRTLIAAQAAGDLQTLRSHGLAAERVSLEGDPATALPALTERITGLLQAAPKS